MPDSDFRIILVGGGPVGLVAAHIFAAAGIKFVLLEQRSTIVPQQGAGIVLFPHTQRVFEQLGLMDRIREIAHKFSENRVVDGWGWHYDTTYSSKWTEENHGAEWLFLHRPELLQVLYDALPDAVKPHVLPGKKVEGVEVKAGGVSVSCTDGTVETGSIVVGADGVHSRIRSTMQKLALDGSDKALSSEEEAFVSTYRCMYGTTGKIPGLEVGPEWDLHSSGLAMQLFGTEEKSWFLFYDKLPNPSRERVTYSEDEMAQLAARVADVYVTTKVRFRDVWSARKWCMLADLPEGILKRWFHDRIVLVGDAASKQTPNIGQGWNCGVQDVVILTNELYSVLKTRQEIGIDQLASIFHTYQDTRYPDLEGCSRVAAGATRAATWDTWSAWLMDRFITPWKGGSKAAFTQGFGTIISKGEILSFIQDRNCLEGALPWQRPARSVQEG